MVGVFRQTFLVIFLNNRDECRLKNLFQVDILYQKIQFRELNKQESH